MVRTRHQDIVQCSPLLEKTYKECEAAGDEWHERIQQSFAATRQKLHDHYVKAFSHAFEAHDKDMKVVDFLKLPVPSSTDENVIRKKNASARTVKEGEMVVYSINGTPIRLNADGTTA